MVEWVFWFTGTESESRLSLHDLRWSWMFRALVKVLGVIPDVLTCQWIPLGCPGIKLNVLGSALEVQDIGKIGLGSF